MRRVSSRLIGLFPLLAMACLGLGGCSSRSDCPPGAKCPAVVPRVTFAPTINGKFASPRKDGHVPGYRVSPGEHLAVRVAVTVPRNLRITELWFGISTGILGGGRNGTATMHPILTHYRQPLFAGSHAFEFRWHIPDRPSGTNLYLVTAWVSQQPPGNVSQFVAQLKLS
jgi:hypothetical protein